MDRPTACHFPWRLLSVGTLLVAGCGRPASPSSAEWAPNCEPRRLELPAAVQRLGSQPVQGITPAAYPPQRFPTTAEATTPDSVPADAEPPVAVEPPVAAVMPAEDDERSKLQPVESPAQGAPVAEASPSLPAAGADALVPVPLPSVDVAPQPPAASLTYVPVSALNPPEPPSPAASSAAAVANPSAAAARGVPSRPMAAVNRRAEQLVGEGVGLAERGALYSARAQFIQALRMLAEAHDAQAGSDVCSHALSLGLTALRESRDFRPQRGSAESGVEVKYVVAAHRTPILKGETQVSPLAATQRYLNYARSQFEIAAGNEPAASFALYGLGRIAALGATKEGSVALGDVGQAMVYYRAAITADARNFRAANELGVLLGDNGRWDLAREMFLHGLKTTQEAALWRNLAVAYDRVGQPALAAQARSHLQQSQTSSPEVRYQWLDPATFARTPSATDATIMPPPGSPTSPPAGSNTGTAAQPNRTQRR